MSDNAAGGTRNIFGTLFELLVFREFASGPVIEVDKAEKSLSLTSSEEDVYSELRSLCLESQKGDTDFLGQRGSGICLVQLKASLNPAGSEFMKGHLNSALRKAVDHVLNLGAKSGDIQGFYLVTNRTDGNIKGLADDIKAIRESLEADSTLHAEAQLCPPQLGMLPGARDPIKPGQSCTLGDWCKALFGGDASKGEIALQLLIHYRHLILSDDELAAKFHDRMRKMGLDPDEASRLGSQLFGDFLTHVGDSDSAKVVLQKSIFDTAAQFHRFDVQTLSHLESARSSSMWKDSGLHCMATDTWLHAANANTQDRILKSIQALLETASPVKILVVTGDGGMGKTFQVMAAINSLRSQGIAVLVPGSVTSASRWTLDDAGHTHFAGYSRLKGGRDWIDRLVRCLDAFGVDSPVIVYLPDADELLRGELENLLRMMRSNLPDRVRFLLTARSRVANQFGHRSQRGILPDDLDGVFSDQDIDYVLVERLEESSVCDWLRGFGVKLEQDTYFEGDAPPTEDERTTTMGATLKGNGPANPRLSRLCHPMLFASLGRSLFDLEQFQERLDYLQSYLSGETSALSKFWEAAYTTLAYRLMKHRQNYMIEKDAFVGALQTIYAGKSDRLWDKNTIKDCLYMIPSSSQDFVVEQLIQLGLLKVVNPKTGELAWSFSEFTPEEAIA